MSESAGMRIAKCYADKLASNEVERLALLIDQAIESTHDAAIDGFLQRPHEVNAPYEGQKLEVPEAWYETPIARIRWGYDQGDPSVGIPHVSGFALDDDQSGTVIGELIKSSKET